MTKTVPQHEVYRTYMVEAKLRLLAAERVSNSSHSLTGLTSLDMEFCFLQIRRVIEAIAFSAMVRVEERYKQHREKQRQQNQKDHGDSSKDWHAPEILKSLASLSPYALPIPLAKATRQNSGLVHFDRAQINVNHGRLIDMYKQCGGYMHGKSPLVKDFGAQVEAGRTKYVQAPTKVSRYLQFLHMFLWHHAVIQLDWSNPEDPKSLDGVCSAWIVDFGSNESNEIIITIAKAEN